ncbi:Ribose-5-phosphate isomerase [Colletotrichum fructicola]|nr:Ribose-5-phosphate isomerase [Colletotrichum fructicola]
MTIPSKPRPMVYINGFPGTGKLTVGKVLDTASDKIKLVHNHLLINPAEAVLSRDQPGYQDLRRRIRSAIFESLIHEPSTYSTLYVFTDAQTANEAGSAVCQEYKDCADRRGCEFIPITLDCDEQTNLGRLIEGGRQAEGKLIDTELLKLFRAGEDLYDFDGHPHRLRIDVSHLSPQVAASEILAHVASSSSCTTSPLLSPFSPPRTRTTVTPKLYYARAMSSAVSLVESAKKAAAYRAVDEHLDASARFVGIGSGSTVVYVVDAIAAKGPSFWSNMTFFPTGSQSKGLIRAAGLRLCNLDERPLGPDGKLVALDVAFDGADEVDADLNCIKGGGACLLQEKLVAIAAKKFVVVADYRKLSQRLLTNWKAIPIEVLPMSAPDVLDRLTDLGSIKPIVRPGLPAKAGEAVTDNGMWIIDAPFPQLLLPSDVEAGASRNAAGAWEVSALAKELLLIPGIVEIGIFHGLNGLQAAQAGKFGLAQKPVAAYFGMEDGSVKVTGA